MHTAGSSGAAREARCATSDDPGNSTRGLGLIELLIVVLLASSVAPAFMPTPLALRRALGCFCIIAIVVFFAALGAFGKVEFGLGGPEALIIGGVLSLVLLALSSAIRVAVFRSRNAKKPGTRSGT